MKEEIILLRSLRAVAAVEATTLVVLLFVAVPLKYLWGFPMMVHVMGPVHGIAFASYLWLVISTASSGLRSRSEVARLLLFAVVPFGGFANAGWLERKRLTQ